MKRRYSTDKERVLQAVCRFPGSSAAKLSNKLHLSREKVLAILGELQDSREVYAASSNKIRWLWYAMLLPNFSIPVVKKNGYHGRMEVMR